MEMFKIESKGLVFSVVLSDGVYIGMVGGQVVVYGKDYSVVREVILKAASVQIK
jgi:hypothetical protein